MKRVSILFLAICLALALVSCTNGDAPNQMVVETSTTGVKVAEVAFEGKIAIITDSISDSEDRYFSAKQVVAKYGKDKVTLWEWPGNYIQESDKMADIITKIDADSEVKAIIINRAIIGVHALLEKLRETREDIFIICCDISENPADMAQIANLVLRSDDFGMGAAMVRQAQKLGAKTFVYYSFPDRYWPLDFKRFDFIKEECVNLGLDFVEVASFDPETAHRDDRQSVRDIIDQFFLEDVPKKVEEYGKDTAFFSADCIALLPLTKAVVDSGAIYPQPCHAMHGLFPLDALDIFIGEKEYKETPNEDLITRIRSALAERDMLGRISTWPVTDRAMFSAASAEYAIKWINGEVPKKGIDVEVLGQLMGDYAGVEVFLTPFVDDGIYDFSARTSDPTGETYDNYLLVRMDYITFE